MIYYLVSRRHRYTLEEYLGSWGKEMAARVRVVPYGALPANPELPAGTYVFSDVERLNAAQASLLVPFWDQLARVPVGMRLINHPTRSLGRRALLARLAERGDNRYRAFSVDEAGKPWRYPVFVREEREHTGALTQLLQDEAELRDVMRMLTMEGYQPDELMVVEFCDTKDDQGIYRKYSAFLVAGRILPRHVLFSRTWMQKDIDLLEESHRQEIREYCSKNPHEAELRRIFAEAAIDYGRIDYSMLDGAVVVWEINTNPIVARPPEAYPDFSLKFHGDFAKAFNAAFVTLDSAPDVKARVPITWE